MRFLVHFYREAYRYQILLEQAMPHQASLLPVFIITCVTFQSGHFDFLNQVSLQDPSLLLRLLVGIISTRINYESS